MSALTRYDKARAALQAAHRVDEVKEIIDQAAAVLEYARRARDTDMIAWATEIQQDAARKAGALLAEMREAGERVRGGGDTRKESPKNTLSDLGVTATQSSRWQALSRLDEEAFEARKAEATRRAVASVEMTRDERQDAKRERREAREVELGARILALPDAKFGVIVADPAWQFEPYSRKTGMDRSADNHYPTEVIHAIAKLPVTEIAAEDCALFLWATVPMLPQALLIMSLWGFEYRSHCVWIKDRVGTGYWFRNRHELLLLGIRGEVPAPAMGDQFNSAIEAPVGEHSKKPEAFLALVENYFPTLPKIELNRRGPPRPGWASWGNEAEQARAAE